MTDILMREYGDTGTVKEQCLHPTNRQLLTFGYFAALGRAAGCTRDVEVRSTVLIIL